MEVEVVLESGAEARPKACSSETEPAKRHDSGEKTLRDDFVQENGVKVSDNGDQIILSVEDANKAVVETTSFNDSGVIEDCVMNGVSSLLKLKQDFNDKDNLQEIDQDQDVDDAEEEAQEHVYHVGDFVWGKIKHHPWWPGQIYDPSDASDLALKIKQNGKLLVAYFGDGTFAWCSASQLKPFAESFNECSKMRSSRGFLVAVEEAVEEMGRHIERFLICDCTEEEQRKFDCPTPEANNAGIKQGPAVCDVRREIISSLVLGKPEEILKHVKTLAETVSISSLLELEILKRNISVFYRSKRGYCLPEYHEPQPVPGLEDKNDDDGPLKWRAKRSIKEAQGKEAVELEDSVQRSLEKCSGFPDHRLLHRRKQKSIAEILENESAAKVRLEGDSADENVKSARKKVMRRDQVKGEVENVTTTTTPRRRRMSEVSTSEDTGRKKVVENGKDKTLSRKRKIRDDDDREESAHKNEIEKSKASDLEIDIDSTPLASLRKRVRVDASNVESKTGNVETATQTPKRERKKSKYLSPDYLSDFSWKGRKKSKTQTESSKVSSESQVGEQLIGASECIVTEEEDKMDKPCEPSDDGLGHQELSEEVSNAVDFLRLGATSTEIRDLIRLTALGTQYPKDSSSRDIVREFMSIYRSFTYHEGTNSKVLGTYNKDKEELNEAGKPGKRREGKKRKAKQQAEEIEEEENETRKKERESKKPKLKQQADEEEEETGKGSKKPEHVEEETRKEPSEMEKPEKKQKRKKKKKREGKSKEKRETEKEFAGADLFVTFGPGSSLPKKEELIEVYGKFGALEEERTYMFYNNFCARVAFLNVTDGEKAFESSQEKCPFACNSTVNFRLKYPSERREEKKSEAEADCAEATMKMEYVKRKLEEMRSLVDESEGGMMEEVKKKLEDEMVNLLEKVREI